MHEHGRMNVQWGIPISSSAKERRTHMNRWHVLIATCLLSMATSTATVQSTANQSSQKEDYTSSTEYTLVWSDEFNKDGRPDPQNWTYESGFVRNRELQWYQQDNAKCENGLLVIEGRRERKLNPDYEPKSRDWKEKRKYAEYTSASLTTKGLHNWMYGRFEMRGRIDTRAGLWPTFWTMGIEGEWPSNGEIDIMEYYRGTLLANAAWGTGKRWVPTWDASKKSITEFNDSNWSAKFHTWRMDWDKDSIKLYVDDICLNTIDLNETFNKDKEGKNPFRQPHYIILNLAIGGWNGGDPSGTEFPGKFEVDYVRIYKRQPRKKGDEPNAP